MSTTPNFVARLRSMGRIVASGFTDAWNSWKRSRFYQALTVSAVLVLIAEEVFGIAVIGALEAAFKTLFKVSGRPVGVAGLGLLILLGAWACILLFKAYRETRPYERLAELDERNRVLEGQVQTLTKDKPPELKPPPLSDAEGKEVQALREVWTRWGEKSMEAMHDLFVDVYRDLKNSKYWADLLEIKAVNLQIATKAMGKALDDKAAMRPAGVREQFQDVYGNYLLCCRWLSRINRYDLKLEEQHAGKLEEWRGSHRKFFDRLRGLETHPAYEGLLKVDPAFRGEQHYMDFMLAAGHTFD